MEKVKELIDLALRLNVESPQDVSFKLSLGDKTLYLKGYKEGYCDNILNNWSIAYNYETDDIQLSEIKGGYVFHSKKDYAEIVKSLEGECL